MSVKCTPVISCINFKIVLKEFLKRSEIFTQYISLVLIVNFDLCMIDKISRMLTFMTLRVRQYRPDQAMGRPNITKYMKTITRQTKPGPSDMCRPALM